MWVGYDRTDKAHYLTTSGGAVPAVLFREMMSRALAQTPIVPFDMPIVGAEAQAAKDSNSSEESDKNDKEDKKEREHGHGKGKKR